MEGIEVEVLDIRVSDGPEVPGDLRLRPDADEERLPGGALAADPDPLNQLSFKTQPSPSVSTSSRVRVRA